MKKYYLIIPLMSLILLSALPGVTEAQIDNRLRILFVDETRSFELSMRIQGLVKGLRDRQELEVDAMSVEVNNPTINPVKKIPEEPYDLVIIVPPTIETGAIKQVWLITKPITEFPLNERRKVMGQLDQLKGAVSQAFEGKISPVGVDDDLIPAYFSTLFLREGILR